MVGSSAWVCNTSVGVSTIAGQASCTQNANGSPGGQALAAGARILLKRNLGWFRCCPNVQAPSTPWLGTANHGTNLQALEWADAFKYGKVTISDIALAATVFGRTNSTSSIAAYFAHPFYSADPSASTVDIGDIAVAAFYFDHGLTSPLLGTGGFPTGAAPAGLTQYTPNVDPFLLTTKWVYYFGATQTAFTMAIAPGESGTITASANPQIGGTCPAGTPISGGPANAPYNGGPNGGPAAYKWNIKLSQSCAYIVSYTLNITGDGVVQGQFLIFPPHKA
jgi:hypothetical protein